LVEDLGTERTFRVVVGVVGVTNARLTTPETRL
jgi:hypothetical protein